MKSPPKMPQMAMVRIWVASLHQKTSVTITLVFVLPGILSFTFKGGFEQLRRCRKRQRKNSPVQQRRPLPAAEAGRSCWGCGQRDARAAQGTMQPLGAATRVPFYSARLATSTRAHQKDAQKQPSCRPKSVSAHKSPHPAAAAADRVRAFFV